MAALEFVDETPFGFGWIHPEPAFMARASHAIRAGGGVWLIDPVDGDGLRGRIDALGAPVAGVVQGLDRHPRSNAALASSFGVPLHEVPREAPPGAPFAMVSVTDLPRWRELGLWFAQERVLLIPESLGAGPSWLAGDETVGVHPMRRLLPPYQLREYAGRAEHLLFGHGPGVHGVDAVERAILDALDGSRRRIPHLGLSLLKLARSR